MVVILLVTIFIGFNFIYAPVMKEMRGLASAVKEAEGKKELVDEAARLEEDLTRYLRRGIPPGKAEMELLDRVREIAGESGAQVTSILPQKELKGREKEGYRKYTIRISFQGSYHTLGDFISKIENSEKMMKIDSLEFSPAKEGTSSLQCDVTLSLFSVM